MSTTRELHDAAMGNAELALIARLEHRDEEATSLFGEALQLELAAVEVLPADSEIEPTRSVLLRSAATLALDCGDAPQAERLIARALLNVTEGQTAEELRDLLEQVHFRRHLQLRGITLDEDELQMSLAGQGVGFGVVNSDEVLQRVENTSRMLYRIAERRRNLPFREAGRPKKAVSSEFELFLSVPRAASFAVTLKIGKPTAQGTLPGLDYAADVVDELMDLMTLIDKGDYQGIEKRIPQQAYRTNFLQLAKRLAPDGTDVQMVGFTALRSGTERFVEVTRPKGRLLLPETPSAQAKPQRVTVSGTLKFADKMHGDEGQIRLAEEGTNKTHKIKVPEGMMNDIVKPLWDSAVVITGTKEGKYIRLEDIDSL